MTKSLNNSCGYAGDPFLQRYPVSCFENPFGVSLTESCRTHDENSSDPNKSADSQFFP